MSEHGFRHEAFLYAGEAEFLIGTLSFIRRGLEGAEAVLVVETEDKIRLLRRELGEDASSVHFADMGEVGANPARIIPAWRQFVLEHGRDGGGLRGIGEPIFPQRSSDELVECQRHESLLNVAFAEGRPWKLMCPYDVAALPAHVIEEARRSHAYVTEHHVELPSPHYRGHGPAAAMLEAPLAAPPADATSMPFGERDLSSLRSVIAETAARAGLHPNRIPDFVSAVNEVATNSIRHGGGEGTVVIWTGEGELACEVRDRGRFDKPLADRERPAGTRGPRGLWLANQLCDLVQIRSYASGTVVRLIMKTRMTAAA